VVMWAGRRGGSGTVVNGWGRHAAGCGGLLRESPHAVVRNRTVTKGWLAMGGLCRGPMRVGPPAVQPQRAQGPDKELIEAGQSQTRRGTTVG
jgi:hypothetical protein